MSTIRDWLACRDRILAKLCKAQKDRPLQTVDQWIISERRVMMNAVNEERIAAGLPLVTEDAILSVERMACGHSDYSQKFALYCAELAVPDRNKS